jgi:hypothetical protein
MDLIVTGGDILRDLRINRRTTLSCRYVALLENITGSRIDSLSFIELEASYSNTHIKVHYWTLSCVVRIQYTPPSLNIGFNTIHVLTCMYSNWHIFSLQV